MDENKLWTVKDMIEKLNEFPQDMPVMCQGWDETALYGEWSFEPIHVIDYGDGWYVKSDTPAWNPPPEVNRFIAVFVE